MRDYVELNQTIRELRDNNVIYHFSRDYLRNVMHDAADAIEELLAENTEAFSADVISMQNAVETDVWLMVWAAEPNRKIHVQMTYDELWKIVQRERENAIEPPKEDAE